MGKGDIRTRRGKVHRGTYGVTRPRRYKTVIKPKVSARKVKTLKDLPKAAAEAVVEAVVENSAAAVAEDASVDGAAKKPAKKAPAAKKPAAKKAPAKKD
jgi:ribosomal small subunit protein bTHX